VQVDKTSKDVRGVRGSTEKTYLPSEQVVKKSEKCDHVGGVSGPIGGGRRDERTIRDCNNGDRAQRLQGGIRCEEHAFVVLSEAATIVRAIRAAGSCWVDDASPTCPTDPHCV
jgi:hypothetical protein